MKTTKEILNQLETRKDRSAWDEGVRRYALELMHDLIDWKGEDYELCGSPADMKLLLNDAENWIQYSEGGGSLICDEDIAKRLCTPSELKRTRGGERNPNGSETWIDVQARALCQAALRIKRLAH